MSAQAGQAMAQVTPAPQGSSANPTFSLRLVTINHYMAKPIPALDVAYCQLAGGAIEQVPIVRIFGSTPAGQKVCLHLHKVGPRCKVISDKQQLVVV